jgi:hypothetical protein
MFQTLTEDDMIRNAEREAKRRFLKEEVLDNGFSPEEFIAYCGDEKGNDIDLWDFNELQDFVRKF